MQMLGAAVFALALSGGAGVQIGVAQDVLWEAKPGFRDFGPMVVANGVVLTGNITGSGGTFAFDAASGKLLWRAAGVQLSAPVTDGSVGYSVNTGQAATVGGKGKVGRGMLAVQSAGDWVRAGGLVSRGVWSSRRPVRGSAGPDTANRDGTIQKSV